MRPTVKVTYPRPLPEAPSLFAGHGWMDAAECWALLEGDLTISRWVAVGQRFAVGPQWYTVTWSEGEAGALGQWTITPEEDRAVYVYIRSEPGLWTVGFYKPDGEFVPESDHASEEAAAQRVHWLNGGNKAVNPVEE